MKELSFDFGIEISFLIIKIRFCRHYRKKVVDIIVNDRSKERKSMTRIDPWNEKENYLML